MNKIWQFVSVVEKNKAWTRNIPLSGWVLNKETLELLPDDELKEMEAAMQVSTEEYPRQQSV